MRLALISDIHSNLQALTTCIEAADRAGADEIACLGDVVGYGASPNECLDLLRERCRYVVLGNHDAAVIDVSQANYFNGDARAAVEWTRSQLSDDNLEFLSGLGLTQTWRDSVLLVHSTPSAPSEWHYLFQAAAAEPEFESFSERVCFYGHTHLPTFFIKDADGVRQALPPELTLAPDERAIVNVGSVGQPRDGDPRASFCVYDQETSTIEIHRLHYDIETVQGRILETPLPRSGAERLAWGV